MSEEMIVKSKFFHILFSGLFLFQIVFYYLEAYRFGLGTWMFVIGSFVCYLVYTGFTIFNVTVKGKKIPLNLQTVSLVLSLIFALQLAFWIGRFSTYNMIGNATMSQGIEFVNDKSVVITLSELESGFIPDDFWDSEEIEKLTIQKVKSEDSWTVHPPLLWFENRELTPPYWSIPERIGMLSNLESLYLVDLDIRQLPNEFTKLNKLKMLNLSLNKLELSNELSKFRELKSLTILKVFGNHFDVEEMEKFKQDFPDIDVEYR